MKLSCIGKKLFKLLITRRARIVKAEWLEGSNEGGKNTAAGRPSPSETHKNAAALTIHNSLSPGACVYIIIHFPAGPPLHLSTLFIFLFFFRKAKAKSYLLSVLNFVSHTTIENKKLRIFFPLSPPSAVWFFFRRPLPIGTHKSLKFVPTPPLFAHLSFALHQVLWLPSSPSPARLLIITQRRRRRRPGIFPLLFSIYYNGNNGAAAAATANVLPSATRNGLKKKRDTYISNIYTLDGWMDGWTTGYIGGL